MLSIRDLLNLVHSIKAHALAFTDNDGDLEELKDKLDLIAATLGKQNNRQIRPELAPCLLRMQTTLTELEKDLKKIKDEQSLIYFFKAKDNQDALAKAQSQLESDLTLLELGFHITGSNLAQENQAQLLSEFDAVNKQIAELHITQANSLAAFQDQYAILAEQMEKLTVKFEAPQQDGPSHAQARVVALGEQAKSRDYVDREYELPNNPAPSTVNALKALATHDAALPQRTPPPEPEQEVILKGKEASHTRHTTSLFRATATTAANTPLSGTDENSKKKPS